MTQAEQTAILTKPRDLDDTRVVLERWLAERLHVPSVSVVGLDHPVGAGVSNETILFSTRWADDSGPHELDLVLRIHPRPSHQFFMWPRFRDQFDLLTTLHDTGAVRVPKMLWLEEDLTVLGQQFFIMEALQGRVPVSMPVYSAEGFLKDATPSQRHTAWRESIEQLSRIHLVEAPLVESLVRPELGEDGVAEELEYWRRSIEWSLPDHSVPPFFHDLHEWLVSTRPDEDDTGLIWGDARLGNIMFGDDFKVVGVFDWEQASFGGPMQDIGWWTTFDRFYSTDKGLPRLDGLGTEAETIDLWQELTGRTVHDLEWYQAFAAYKLGVCTLRSAILAGLTAEHPFALPPLVRAGELAGLVVPEQFR